MCVTLTAANAQNPRIELKDAQIDCSNTSAFITTVENRYMLTKEGIDFCFNSTENRGEFVIISFTWAELKPFLKMKMGE